MEKYYYYKKLIKEIYLFLKIDETTGLKTNLTLFENSFGKISYSCQDAFWEEKGKTVFTTGRLDLYRSRTDTSGFLYDPFHVCGAFSWLGIFHKKTKDEMAEILIPSLEKKLKEYCQQGKFL